METYFERAIFISWYCKKGDCTFCYMSTQKDRIKEPLKAKRTVESVLAEAILCRLLDWKIEFLSGGYECYRREEFLSLVSLVKRVYGKKLWLNTGTMDASKLASIAPYLEGFTGALECINEEVRKKVCPSKSLNEIESSFKSCDSFGLKKGVTVILGIGETLDDLPSLISFIKKHSLDRITFYRLKPQKGTEFEKANPIGSEYFGKWVKATRNAFPQIKIIVGSTLSKMQEIPYLLSNGADNFTKFPAFKKFGSTKTLALEKALNEKGIYLKSNITKKINLSPEQILSKYDVPDNLKQKVSIKLKQYLSYLSN